MEEINRRLLFTVAGTRRTGQPGPGTFRVVREGGSVLLTYPCPPGGLAGSNMITHFRANDGRTWLAEWVGVADDRTRFRLPDDYPNGTV